MKILNILLCFFILNLAACGGGGGSSGSAGSNSSNGTSGGSFNINKSQLSIELRPGQWGQDTIIINVTDPKAVYVAAGFDEGQSQVSWLDFSVNQSGGSQFQLNVLANTSGLTVGTYSAKFTIGTANSDEKILDKKIISVTLKVSENLAFEQPMVTQVYPWSDADTELETDLYFYSGATTLWTATSDAAWLTFKNPNGTGFGELKAVVNAKGLVEGTYTSQIVLSENGNPTNKTNLTYTIKIVKPIEFTEDQVQRNYVVGLSEQETIDVDFIADATTEWQATSDQSWMTINNFSGVGSGKLTLAINPSGLQVGTHQATIRLSDKDSLLNAKTFVITVDVVAPISLSATDLSPTVFYGLDNAQVSVIEQLTASDITEWTIQSNQSWLQVANSSGIGSADLQILANMNGMAPGNYTAALVVVDKSNSRNTKTLNLSILVLPPQLTVYENTILLGDEDGLGSPVGELGFAVNSSNESSPYQISVETDESQNWLIVNSTNGLVSNLGTILAINADANNLHSGTYHATLHLKVQVGEIELNQSVSVIYNEEANRLVVSHQGVAFTASPNRSVLSRNLTIFSAIDRTDIPWNATSNQSWLSVTDGGMTGDQLQLIANPDGLSVGTHFAEVTIISPDNQVENQEKVRVGLTVLDEDPVDSFINFSTTKSLNDLVSNQILFGMVASPVEPLVFVNLENQISAYNLFTGDLERNFNIASSQARSLTISQDGRKLYVYDTGTFEVLEIDSETGEVLHRYKADDVGWMPENQYPEPAYLRPNAKPILVSAGSNIYDLETQELISDSVYHPGAPGISGAPFPNWLVTPWGDIYQYFYTALGSSSGALKGDWIMSGLYAPHPQRQACTNTSHLFIAGGATNIFTKYNLDNKNQEQSLMSESGYPNSIVCGWNGLVVGGINAYYGEKDIFVYDGNSGVKLMEFSSSTDTNYRSLFNRGLILSGDNQRLISVSLSSVGFIQFRFLNLPLVTNN
jgi:Viral BACON domain